MTIVITMIIGMTADHTVDRAEFQSYPDSHFIPESTPKIDCGALLGTGTAIGSHTLITAYHVVGTRRTCTMRSGLRTIELVVIARDPANDFAILRPRGFRFTRPYRVSCLGFVTNQNYSLAGYPAGGSFAIGAAIASPTYYVVTGGVNLVRFRSLKGMTFKGMSGGPIVDSAGSVVGIVSAKLKNNDALMLSKELKDTSVCRNSTSR